MESNYRDKYQGAKGYADVLDHLNQGDWEGRTRDRELFKVAYQNRQLTQPVQDHNIRPINLSGNYSFVEKRPNYHL